MQRVRNNSYSLQEYELAKILLDSKRQNLDIYLQVTPVRSLGVSGGLGMSEIRKPVASEHATNPIFGPSAQPLLNSSQAAQFLGVHPRTLQRMVRRGEITGVRVGKLWRFVPSSIRDWVQEHNIAS
jgi:excisionase family DNA binding protein